MNISRGEPRRRQRQSGPMDNIFWIEGMRKCSGELRRSYPILPDEGHFQRPRNDQRLAADFPAIIVRVAVDDVEILEQPVEYSLDDGERVLIQQSLKVVQFN